MIRVQARGSGTTHSDYRFLGRSPDRWWDRHPAAQYMRWEELAVLAEADAAGWRAVVFGIDAVHHDAVGRPTQIMLEFSGQPGDADADLLARLLSSVLESSPDAARLLGEQLPLVEIEKLRAWSALGPDREVPDTAGAAGAEAELRVRAALAGLAGADIAAWTDHEDHIGIAVHARTGGASTFLSMVADLCAGHPGRALLTASLQNKDGAEQALDELMPLPGVSIVLVTRGNRPFAETRWEPVEVVVGKKAHRAEPGTSGNAGGSGGSGSAGGSGGTRPPAPRMTLIGANRHQTVQLFVDSATHGSIALHYPMGNTRGKVRVTLAPDGRDARVDVELAAGKHHTVDATVTRTGTVLTCTGTVHSTTVVVEVDAMFDWSGLHASASLIDQAFALGKGVVDRVTG